MYGIKKITPASDTPITLAEAKTQCRLAAGINYHDDELQRLIDAVTEYAETRTARAILTSTWRWTLDRFPRSQRYFALPYPPLQSVSSITYIDTDGDSQTFDAANYRVDTDSEPGLVILKQGKSWPATVAEVATVTVTFVAGYASTPTALPKAAEHVKAGMLLRLEALWRRETNQHWQRQMDAAERIFESVHPGDELHAYSA